VTLLDGHGDPAMTVTVAHGTYVLDPATGTVSFVPIGGFVGTPDPVDYQVMDAYGQTATGTYQPLVTAPPPPRPSPSPAAGPTTSKGAPGVAQQAQVTVPAGGSIVLLDADGYAVTELVVPGVGTFSVAPTGVLTFTPTAGYTGTGTSVRYRIADAYGQTTLGTYSVTVAATEPKGGDARVAAPALVRNARTMPATCRLTSGTIASCTVSAYAVIRGERVLVGKGSAKAGGSGKASVTVRITLNSVGRALAAQPHGVSVALVADVRQAAVSGHRYATATSRVVAPIVRLRPVHFTSDSATLRPADRAYLRSVSAQLGGVRSITCIGHTDARATTPYNARLGLARAKALCAVLVGKRHIAVTVVSRGELWPAYSNATSGGRALNRRGEVVLKY
jgi:CshA-type fibril repeat protein